MTIDKFLKQKRAVVLTNGVSINLGITKAKAKRLVKLENYFNVVFVGRLVKEKGVIILIKAIENLNGVFLHIIGEGEEERRLKEYANKKGIKNIKFYGKLNREKTFLITKASDCCAFPLFVAAGVNNAVLEAMLLEVPVIGTNTGFFNEFKNGKNILLTECGNVSDLKDAISRLKKNRRLRNKISKNARRLVKEKYNWGVIVEKFLMILKADVKQ